MERWKKRSVNLLSSLAFGSGTSPSVIPYYPQKTRISQSESRYFVRSTPERHGISSRRIFAMLCALEAEKRANVHTLMILHDGEVISECARQGYDVNIWRLSHSMSKTVTGMAIGFLFDEGRINLHAKLTSIFPDIKFKDKLFPKITVEHLLAMTSGITFGEAGSITETDWTQAFFDSPIKFAPGTQFAYNSMNSYILARIVERVTGLSLTDFLRPRLFEPLHIENCFWERGPENTEKGGWGLYMSIESWAKLGQMMLSGGIFEGRQILSREWIERSTSMQATSPTINGDFNYGYQLWVGRNGEDILFNGMLGQNVWICPKNRIVAVISCANNELFQDSPALETVRKYLGCTIRDGELDRRDIRVLHDKESHFFDCRRWVTPLEKKHGLLYWLGVRNRTAYDDKWDDILGEYAFARNNVGMLPLFVRGLQNNLDSRLERMTLERWGDGLYLSFTESAENYRIEVGLYGYKEAVLGFRGERYIVRAMGEALLTPDGETEYRIELVFPELPNVRMLRIFGVGDSQVSVSFTEEPNNKIADALIERATASPPIAFGLDLLESRFGDGFINRKVEDTFAPVLVAARVSCDGFCDIIERENKRAEEQSKAVKLIRSLVDKFFTDPEPKEETPRPQERHDHTHNIFLGIIDRIRSTVRSDRQDRRAERTERDNPNDKRSEEKKKISRKRAERYSSGR